MGKVHRPRVLFVHNSPQRFVVTDREILAQQFEVVEWYVKSRRIDLLVTLTAVLDADVVFCWFASWHSLFPTLIARLTGRPAVVVVGGYDVANVPQLHYGSLRGGLRRWISILTMHFAHVVLPFSQSASAEVQRADISPDKVKMIYLGVDFDASDARQVGHRESMVVTVGGVWEENLLRKGLLPFVEAARFLPDVKFVLVGNWFDDSIQQLRAAASSNVEFTGYLADDDLADLLCRASVYVQASLHEGFGLSVAEAMLAGCIPVTTFVGSLPELVGDTGVCIESNQPQDVADAIERALLMDNEARIITRQRIIESFDIELRRTALTGLLSTLMNAQRSGNHD